MILQLCGDESYNTGENSAIVFAGWLSRADNFKGFCDYWKTVLDAYGAAYFHFAEFADKNHRSYSTTPYDGWDELKRENFLFDLALVACEVGVPIGGCVPAKTLDETTIRSAYHIFFTGAQNVLHAKFPDDKLDFIFDEQEDPKWLNGLTEKLTEFKAKGAPFNANSFEDDKIFLPLQAADLYAYAMRQNAERFYLKNREPGQPRLLDLILEKNRVDCENWSFHWEHWQKLMHLVISHYREWKAANPKQKYYPLIHCPLLQN